MAKFKKKPCEWLPARYVLTAMFFLGMMNAYILRSNISVAIVAMIRTAEADGNGTDGSTSICGEFSFGSTPANKTMQNQGEFDWDETQKGRILSAFFYGYVFMQVPGGYLETKFGGKKVYGISMLIGAILTLLTPVAARVDFWFLFFVRFFMGFFQGVIFPAHHGMWGKWAPPLERSRLLSITCTGTNVGTVIALALSGYIIDQIGWPWVFYITGIVALVWFVAWMLLVHDSPAEHPRISEEEREYIESSIGTNVQEDIPVPWLEFAKSRVVWCLLIGHFCNNWGNYTMLTNLPNYMATILGFNIAENGLLSALSPLTIWVFTVTGGWIIDVIRSRDILDTLNSRRLLTAMGQFLPAIFLIISGFVGCDRAAAVAMLALSAGFGGLSTPGFKICHIEIAPRFGGILFGITNVFGSIPGFIAPEIIGAMTNNNQTREAWMNIFWIGASIYVFGGIVVLLFLRTDIQPWAHAPDKSSADPDVIFLEDIPNTRSQRHSDETKEN
ncbi:sialin-like isoform X1 [Branchiostoma floridae]|uniref:Sialin-like isoform X1 n=2 Tax=Branchiostoma floridae TaxID=7739 RepID=A0A9J7HKY4_BRAFL|nr:sialin-like isoform X1 [Branchiostoma floridae]